MFAKHSLPTTWGLIFCKKTDYIESFLWNTRGKKSTTQRWVRGGCDSGGGGVVGGLKDVIYQGLIAC